MECNKVSIDLPKIGIPFHIVPYSDLHLNAAACDFAAVKKDMDAKAKLENARFIILGDALDNIFPGDPRFTGASARGMGAKILRDDYMDECVRSAGEFFARYPIWLYCEGNHDTKIERYTGTSIARRILDEIRRLRGEHVAWGGYSGHLHISITVGGKVPKCTRSGKTTVDIAYHHGAWGGKTGGIIGMRDWLASKRLWDIGLYGHNHRCAVHHEVRMRYSPMTNAMVSEPVHIVNTGTQLASEVQGMTTYSERSGFPPVSLHVPVIRVTMHGRYMDIEVIS